MLMAVALSFAIGFAHADDWSWGVARSQGADVFALFATNAHGAAVLSDADLVGKTVDEIKFTAVQPGATELTVGGIVLSNRTIRFTASESLVLRGDGTNSVFQLTNGDWTLDGLDLNGVGMTDANPEFGGAVECFGGTLTLSGCTFTDFFASQVGGAVCAALMDDDVTVTNCSFSANGVGSYNGYGGAVYASGKGQESASQRLVIADSEFVENLAENGGAICTRTRLYDDEKPIALDICDGTAFVGNVADFGGGAVLSEGALAISGPETSFVGNFAGDDGGAVCIEGSAEDSMQVKVTVSNGVTFADNCVSSRVDWVSGGAISVMTSGCELEVVGATFSNNWAYATSEGALAQCAFGGAVSTAPGCTNLFRKTAFVGNGVQSVAYGVGGAVSACEGETVVDNCVFDCRGTTAANCYGSAVDFDAVRGTVRNTTIRYGATEAVSSVDADLTVVNCVVVGNGTAQGDGAADFRFEGSSTVDMTYSAYGSCAADAAAVAESFNLSNRVAEAVYEGDTLRLDPTGFNPVVELGLVQPDATDFDGIPYVSAGTTITFPRASMGAYELATDRVLVLDVFGMKDYDATTRSNGCAWTWALTDTNGAAVAYDDLVPTNLDAAAASDYLAERFAITNWVFGTEANGGAVGLYDATNETGSAWWLDAGVTARTERVAWLGSVLVLRAHGEIGDSWFILPVDFGGGETNGVYFTWNWMKDNLNRYPTNDFETSCDILRTAQENGYPRWQNYVMGVDGSNSSNRIVTTYAPCVSDESGSRVDVVTPFAASCNPPANVGVEMEYRLYNVTHTRRGILPEDGESWHCYATNSVPRFEGFDLSKLHYGLKDQDRDYGQCLLEIYAIFKKGEKPEGAE